MSNELKRKSDQIDEPYDPQEYAEQETSESSSSSTTASAHHTFSKSGSSSNDSNYVNKIKAIIRSNFDQEISYKQFELEKIDEVL